jgi:predicted aldo/keto reductase-like oxidoreductase
LRALDEAKKQGKIRFVGFTGHKSPAIHLKMLAHDYRLDTVQMPLNCFDATIGLHPRPRQQSRHATIA